MEIQGRYKICFETPDSGKVSLKYVSLHSPDVHVTFPPLMKRVSAATLETIQAKDQTKLQVARVPTVTTHTRRNPGSNTMFRKACLTHGRHKCKRTCARADSSVESVSELV